MNLSYKRISYDNIIKNINTILPMLDFLVYSSHKTSTQSLLDIFSKSQLSAIHCHELNNLKLNHAQFMSLVNHKKLKIITCLRNPFDRLRSSYFQTFHSDEIIFKKIKSTHTTIMSNDVSYLLKHFESLILSDTLPHANESIWELQKIFNFSLDDLILRTSNQSYYHYYYQNEHIELYVLDYDKIVSDSKLKYLKSIFDIDFCEGSDNLSKDKITYDKYKKFIEHKFDDGLIKAINDKYADIIKLKVGLDTLS